MLKNFRLFLLPSLFSLVVNFFVSIPLLSKYLTLDQLGVIGVVTATLIPISSILMSPHTWLLDHYSYLNEFRKSVLNFNIFFFEFILKFIGLGIILLVLLCLDFFKIFIVSNYNYLFLSFFTLLFNFFWSYYSYTLVIGNEAKFHSILEIVNSLTTLSCVTFFFIYSPNKLLGYFLGQFFGALSMAIIVIAFIYPKLTIKFSNKFFRSIFKTFKHGFISNFLEYSPSMFDRFIIRYHLGLEYVGIYSHSFSYKSFFSLFGKSFTKSYGTEAIQYFKTNSSSELGIIQKNQTKWNWLLIFLLLLIIFFSESVINLLTNGKFNSVAPLLPIWFLLLFNSSYGQFYSYFLSFNLKSKDLYKSTFFSFISLLLFFTFCVLFNTGIEGFVFSFVFSNIVLQEYRKYSAIKSGCPDITKKIWWMIGYVIVFSYLIMYNIKHVF